MAYFYPGYSSYFWLSLLFMANTAGPLFHMAVPHWPGVFWSLAVESTFILFGPGWYGYLAGARWRSYALL
jgi:hypothetical protein